MKKSFNIQKLLHYKSKRQGTQLVHPSSWRALQRHQEHDLKHLGLVDLIITKQNKLPSFIHRYVGCWVLFTSLKVNTCVPPSYYLLRKIVSSFCWVEILQIMGPLAIFLVHLKNLWWMGVHQGDFIMFKHGTQKLFNFEYFHQWKFSSKL
jgi:hypothetical protein